MSDPRFAEQRLVDTGDGSHTLHLPMLGEHYHSAHGALRESRHVFIHHGYEAALTTPRGSLCILEMGFGTGLNALLTWERAARDGVTVAYTALEAFPIAFDIAMRLNYPRYLARADAAAVFSAMHDAAWGVRCAFGATFSLTKINIDLRDHQPAEACDLIYFDAFSPAVQPELWTREVFARLYAAMRPGGVLVTYCAKGEVKRNLKAVGFALEGLPGPPGKREITRARKR